MPGCDSDSPSTPAYGALGSAYTPDARNVQIFVLCTENVSVAVIDTKLMPNRVATGPENVPFELSVTGVPLIATADVPLTSVARPLNVIVPFALIIEPSAGLPHAIFGPSSSMNTSVEAVTGVPPSVGDVTVPSTSYLPSAL